MQRLPWLLHTRTPTLVDIDERGPLPSVASAMTEYGATEGLQTPLEAD